MIARTKNKIFFSLVAGVMFLLVAVFGPFSTLGMEMREDGTMGGCLFTMGTAAEICPMTALDHISAWQQLFISTSEKASSILLLFALLAIATVFYVYNKKWRWEELQRNFLVLKLYLKRHASLPTYDTLRELFSRGILNPKIYDSAAI